MNGFRRYERVPTVLDCTGDPGLTEQSHKEDVDMHNIMRQFEKTGIVKHVAAHAGTYGDYVGAPGFQEAMNIIAKAESMFESVPAKIRAKFDNDPGKFVDFMQAPENYQAILDLGLDASHLPKPEAVAEPAIADPPPEPTA